MSEPFRFRLYRLILRLAAGEAIAFGLWAALSPGTFFEVFRMEPPRYPSAWRCLGMVVGLYGLGYAYAAARLDRARPWIAIGLIGKVLGPLGWILAVRSGEWSLRTVPLVLFNDLVWWAPFALFLLEGTKLGARLRALAPHACFVLNAAGALTMLFVLRHGVESSADRSARALYIAAHGGLWRGSWVLWLAAAVSLLGFYAAWGSKLADPRRAVASFSIAAAGLAFDLAAEGLLIGWFPEDLPRLERTCSLLAGAGANGLYTLAGTLLTLGTEGLRGTRRLWTWIVWGSGYGLTAATLAGSVAGMTVATAALMVSFCPWIWFVGRRLA